MKIYLHVIVAIALFVMSLSILFVTQTQANIRPLDTVRLYTKRAVESDTSAALHEVRSAADFLSADCMAKTNNSVNTGCVVTRVTKRADILRHMKCNEYGSQVCSYLRLALQPLMLTVNPSNTPPNVSGADLTKVTSPGGMSYQEMLYDIIVNAPLLFQGAYKAVQSDDVVVIRSVIYNLISTVILANLLIHVSDAHKWENQHMRATVRAIAFISVFITAIVFVSMYPGMLLTFLLIMGMGAVNLVHFEMFLDPTIVRPWIHPFAYAVISMSLAVLALVENGILDYHVYIVSLLAAAAASQLYMANAWYHVGYKEKLRLSDQKLGYLLFEVYTTKETQLGLVTGILLQAGLPLIIFMTPGSVEVQKSLFLATAPLLFSLLSLFSLVVVENLPLDDEYGEVMRGKEERMGWGHNSPAATVITGAKLLASMILLLFGLTVILVWLDDHISTARAFMDHMPEASIKYDMSLSRRYLIGQGLNLLSAI